MLGLFSVFVLFVLFFLYSSVHNFSYDETVVTVSHFYNKRVTFKHFCHESGVAFVVVENYLNIHKKMFTNRTYV